MTSATLGSADARAVDVPKDHVWQRSLSDDTSVDLSTLTDDTGDAFTGIDADHRWLFELYDDSPRLPFGAHALPGLTLTFRRYTR